MFLTVGKPLLLGSVIVSTPIAVVAYFLTRSVVARHQRRKALAGKAGAVDPNPDPDHAP
jgi:hypothetical protein